MKPKVLTLTAIALLLSLCAYAGERRRVSGLSSRYL